MQNKINKKWIYNLRESSDLLYDNLPVSSCIILWIFAHISKLLHIYLKLLFLKQFFLYISIYKINFKSNNTYIIKYFKFCAQIQTFLYFGKVKQVDGKH